MKSLNQLKVVLVSPPNFMSDPLMAEPLGLMYIEGSLRELGVEVEMVDMSFDKELPDGDIYCFTACTVNYLWVVECAKKVKPAYTVLGGSHASALPYRATQYFDAVVVGSGDAVISEVIQDCIKGVKGEVYKKSVRDINDIPIPPRLILERVVYRAFGDETKSATVITSRACPFKCSFCSSATVWGRKVQYRSVGSIVEEVEYLRDRFGIRHIKFVDDIFNLDKSRFRRVSEALSGLGVKWFGEMRVDSVDDKSLDQLVKSGCMMVDLGVESVDDGVLAGIQKNQTCEISRRAIAKVKSRGIKVKAYFIYGLPFEPPDIVERTIDFVEETQPDIISIFTLVPYPGTDIWNNPNQYGIKNLDVNFNRYQHAVGESEDERKWYPVIEYHDRSREQMREERNALKWFAMQWNEGKKI